MDLRRKRTEHSAAVPLDWGFAGGVVLRSGTGDGRESETDAFDRRAVHADAILRGSQDGLVAGRARLCGQSEARAALDAVDGIGSHLPETAAVDSSAGAQDLSVSIAGAEDRPAQSGVVQRHHLHSAAAGVHIPGCGHGLVQPVCVGVGNIDIAGDVVLSRSAGLGSGARTAGNLQHGSRRTIHQRRFHGPVKGSRHRDQHGRAGPGDRQHLHRAIMAVGEIRRGLSEGLLGSYRSRVQSQKLLWVLQSRTSASGVGISDPGDGSFRKTEEPNIGHAGSRVGSRSSPINDPGEDFSHNIGIEETKKEKRSKKERKPRKGTPMETDAAMKIRKGRLRQLLIHDFHRSLKSRRKERSDFFTVTHGLDDG